MQRKMTTAVLAGALLAGSSGQSFAQNTELEQMKAEMAQMRAEMAQLRAQQQGDWMADQRRAEIEGLIADVFADANNRASLLQEGALAGIDNSGKIFLQSSDGQFSANFFGQIQFRYIWNSLETDNTSGTRASESLSGFQTARAKFGVKGTVGDGWGYYLKFATQKVEDSGSGWGAGDTYTEDAYITYDLGDGWDIAAGVKKLPFARQELISSTRQVGVDRALATEFFTIGRSELVQVNYASDDIRASVALSDGGNAQFTGFLGSGGAPDDVSNDFAITGRVDWQAMGDDWGASKHEFGGTDEDALFVGAAVHYEVAEGSAGGLPEDGLAWTIDALYKTGALGLTAALFGNHTDNGAATDTDQYGLYIQGDYVVAEGWDIFGRWDYIDDDGVAGAGTDELQALTVGVNHHFNNNVKFTADVVWVYEGDAQAHDGNFLNGGELSTGLGLTSTGFTAADDHDDQIALRLQLQLLF